MVACSQTGWHVAGLDISCRAVDLAKQIVPNAEFHCGRLSDAPWPENTFQAVTIWEVIEHVSDPLAMVTRAGELLTPGGILAISTPDWGCWAVRSHTAPNYWPPYHVWFFSGPSLQALLERAGLEVTSLRRNPFAWSETLWPKLKRYVALPWLLWRGVVRGEGGGRLAIMSRKPAA